MRRYVTMLTIAGLALLVVASSQAQGPRCWAAGKYDPVKEVAVMGTIQEVEEHPCPCPMKQIGTHLVLSADGKDLDIRLGPSSFLKENDLELMAGDVVEIIGSRVSAEGIEAVIAREVSKDGTIVTLRDEKGVPKWSGCCAGGRPCSGTTSY